MRKFLKSLYLNNYFFLYLIINIVLFVIGHFYVPAYSLSKIAILLFVCLLVIDILLLYNTNKNIVEALRLTPEKLSNGDENKIKIYIENNYNFRVGIKIIDEVPHQFQVRDFLISDTLLAGHQKTYQYILTPHKRGEYEYGELNIYVSTRINFISRRFRFDNKKKVTVYPSFIQMRKYELLAISNRLIDTGIKKIRRISNNKEFEKIRDYVIGDDFRTVNWSATARKNQLMVNEYQDEKSQQVYSLIDMGRAMKMPFAGMTLLDYAINTSLAISNIAMIKQDKAGLISFSKDIHSIVPASRRNSQLNNIMEVLYNQTTNYNETDYELLYANISHRINQRSLLLLYTNFETLNSLSRQIKFFRQLAKKHLLLIIFFENTELNKVLNSYPKTTEEIYIKTIVEKTVFEKKLIIRELKKYGIHSIITEPQNLTLNTINKYLEFKAVGLI